MLRSGPRGSRFTPTGRMLTRSHRRGKPGQAAHRDDTFHARGDRRMPEPQTLVAFVVGAVRFALLCGAGTPVGLGLLALLRFPRERVGSALLAPFVATLAWALAGNLLVRFGSSMEHATPVIWLVSAALAAVGVSWWLAAGRGQR